MLDVYCEKFYCLHLSYLWSYLMTTSYPVAPELSFIVNSSQKRLRRWKRMLSGSKITPPWLLYLNLIKSLCSVLNANKLPNTLQLMCSRSQLIHRGDRFWSSLSALIFQSPWALALRQGRAPTRSLTPFSIFLTKKFHKKKKFNGTFLCTS